MFLSLSSRACLKAVQQSTIHRYSFLKSFVPLSRNTRCLSINMYTRSNHSNEPHQSSPSAPEEKFNESSEQQTNKTSEDEFFDEKHVREKILDAALPFVSSLGWSNEAIASGAEALGYSSLSHGMFNEGGVELVNHFYSQCNHRLEDLLQEWSIDQENPEKKKGTTKFIKEAIVERLKMNLVHIDKWSQAMALHAMPTNAPNALRNIGTLVDHIWYYAGDRSSDFNWYTKRGIVALVYKSTEICMIQDQSIEYKDTWEFLDRRLSDVHTTAKCLKEAGNYTKDFGQITQASIMTILNILGMNKKFR